jgi:glyoxylase-like metal-dependent hydrolase (beta-lactamase superfamily II)
MYRQSQDRRLRRLGRARRRPVPCRSHGRGVTPADIDVVFCTHLHVDHVGWNTRLENGQWVPTFPNARYLFPAEDEAHYGEDPGETYTESVLPVIAAGQAELVRGAHEIATGITLWPTPGHTPGHSSVLIESGGARAVITGDAIHSSAQCGHPGWHFRYDTDPEAAVLRAGAFWRWRRRPDRRSSARISRCHRGSGRVRAKGPTRLCGSRWPESPAPRPGSASSVCRRSRACLCRCKVYLDFRNF